MVAVYNGSVYVYEGLDMNGLRQINIRHVIAVILFSSLLFGVMSLVRLEQTVNILYPRAVLKLDNFHTREYATNMPTTAVTAVAHNANEWRIVVPDTPDISQFRVIEFSIDQLPAEYQRRLLAVFIDNARVLDTKDTGRFQDFGFIIPTTISLRPGAIIRITTIPDDKLTPPPLTVTSATLSNATIYRWSKGDATVHFYGSGGGWWHLKSTMLVQHPDNKDFTAQVSANNTVVSTIPNTQTGFRIYHSLIPPTGNSAGDVAIGLQSATWGGNAQDVRVLGVAVSQMQLRPVASPWYTVVPSLRLASVVVLGLLVAIAAHLMSLSVLGVGISVTSGLIITMMLERAYLAMWYPQLIILVAVSILVIPLCYKVLEWSEPAHPFSPLVRNTLVALVVVSIWVKGGGILYPIMRPIDIEWHMNKVREMLSTGDFAKFYLPGAFSESVMPITEWGENRPMIPYSPFYHFSALLFVAFPWPLEKTATILNAIGDASRILIIALIARIGGLSNRVSLLAAVMYAVAPVTYLLHAWGNTPTTSGLWWTLVTMTALLALSHKLPQRNIMVLLFALHVISMLIYTVTAVFHVVFVTLLVVIIWLIPAHPLRAQLKYMLVVCYGGLAFATLIYYGQYIMPIIERTIPYLLTPNSVHTGVDAESQTSFAVYFSNFLTTLRYDFVANPYLYYGIFMPVLMVVPGFILMMKRPVLWAFAAAWFSVSVLFMFAGYRFPMVDKQIFYMLPIMMICWGMMASGWWRRGWSGQILVLIATLYTITSALSLWVIRIDRAPMVIP